MARVRAELWILQTATKLFYADYGFWPESQDQLLSPPVRGNSTPKYYLAKLARDPWTKKPYKRRLTAKGPVYYSLGADMSEGGEGDGRDIYSKE